MAKQSLTNPMKAQMDWDDLRTSPAFPAIVGGLAGALGGAALMLIVGRLRGPKQTLPAAYDANGNPMNVVYLPAPKSFSILGFTPGDLITLATIGVGLVRQAQEIVRAREIHQETAAIQQETVAMQQGAPLPPSPADKSSTKKKI